MVDWRRIKEWAVADGMRLAGPVQSSTEWSAALRGVRRWMFSAAAGGATAEQRTFDMLRDALYRETDRGVERDAARIRRVEGIDIGIDAWRFNGDWRVVHDSAHKKGLSLLVATTANRCTATLRGEGAWVAVAIAEGPHAVERAYVPISAAVWGYERGL